jgi:hypothetical protein
MLRILPALCAFLLLAASGITHRLWTGAWTVSNEPETSAARLAKVSLSLGDWEGIEVDMDSRQLAQAEAVGYLSRRYIHRRSGAEVSVFIICGRPGPIAVHTPDICYGGIGFKPIKKETQYKVEGNADSPEAEFFKADMSKPDPVTPDQLRIYWGWKAGHGWQAPANPRLKFGGSPALYKLYVVYHPASGSQLPEHDPAEDFMHDLLPELEKVLSPAS